MTDEQFQRLEEFEKHFRTATRFGYIRMDSRQAKRLAEAYNNASGGKMKPNSCMGCGSLNNIKKIAAFYYAEKERREKAEAELQEAKHEQFEAELQEAKHEQSEPTGRRKAQKRKKN